MLCSDAPIQMMILIPICNFSAFWLGHRPSVEKVASCIRTLLARMKTNARDPTSKTLLFQIFHFLFSAKFADTLPRHNTAAHFSRPGATLDSYLGHVDSAALLLKYADVFKESVERATIAFDKAFYSNLGRSFDPDEPIVDTSE